MYMYNDLCYKYFFYITFSKKKMWYNGLNLPFNPKVQGSILFPIIFPINEMDENDIKHLNKLISLRKQLPQGKKN